MFKSDPKMISMKFAKTYADFVYDTAKTPEQNKEDFKAIYDRYMMPEEMMERIGNVVVNHFSLADAKRSSKEQAICQERMLRAQDLAANEVVSLKLPTINLDRKLKEDLGEDVSVSAIARDMTFLRRDDTAEALEFNKKLFLAVTSKNPVEAADAVFESIEHARLEAGITSPEDISRMYDLDDEAFLQNYEKLMTFCRRVSEDRVLKDYDFSPEQREHILQYKDITQSLTQVLESRLETISNPLYPTLNPVYFHDKSPAYLNIDDAVSELIEEEKYGSMEPYSPFGSFVSSIQNYSYNHGIAVPERLALKHPELREAVLSGENRGNFDRALGSFQPVIALMPSGEKMVLTNNAVKDGFVPKMQTSREYSKELYEKAVKVDRFLLTGSKQFDDMKKAARELSELEAKPDATKYQLDIKAYAAVDAAKTYLEYKGIRFPYDNYALVEKGTKNAREQSRIETAMTILAYAQSHTTLSEKIATMEQQGPAKNVDVEKTGPLPQIKSRDFTAAVKSNFLEAFSANMDQLLDRKPPKVKEGANGSVKDAMSKEDFTLLCALACGSDKLYYTVRQNVKDDYGNVVTDEKGDPLTRKGRVTNLHPEETYGAMIEGVFGGQKIKELPGESGRMLTGAQSLVFHALQDGDKIDLLGQLVADGLKQNNQMMKFQKGFTDEFCAFADINDKTLKLLENNPALKDAAMKYLSAEDLRISTAVKALNELHTAGLSAQKLLSRIPSDSLGEQNAVDVAAVCQMYGVEQLLCTNENYLATCPYGTYPNVAEQVNKAISGNQQIKDFVQDLAQKGPKDRIAALNQGDAMANLYVTSIQPKAPSVQQANQPELQMNAVQQSAPSPQKAPM